MAAPSALVLECEECGVTPHRVLSGRVSGKGAFVFQGTVRCTNCGRVRSAQMREQAPIRVPFVVSDGGDSVREEIEFDPNEELRVGMRLDPEGRPLLVTALEGDGRRVPRALAADVRTAWAKTYERVRVRVSIARGKRTSIVHLDAAPDEEFEVGDVIDVGRERVLLHHIETRRGTIRRGTAEAAEIKTAHGRAVRERAGR